LNEKDPGLEAYVIGNATRPLLLYGPKNSRSMRRTYLYVEALQKFDKEVQGMDLTEAYRRAKPAFTGIERLYLYTEVRSSGRSVLASREQRSQVPLAVPVCVRRTPQRGASQDAVLVVDIQGEYPGERIQSDGR
jgi:hypothetical protein